MREVLMVAHSESADGGRLAVELERRGLGRRLVRPFRGEALPEDLAGLAGCVVLGGPMSANDDAPAVGAELAWIPRVVRAGIPFLGVCLGAQLLARALGGRVWEDPEGHVEIGYHPVRATPAGRALGFPAELRVYQWHREGIDLPPGAELLAGADRFPTQAFRYGARAFGLQFHPEMTAATLSRWLRGGSERLARPGAQPPERQWRLHARHEGTVEGWLGRFLDGWLDGWRDGRRRGGAGPGAPAPAPVSALFVKLGVEQRLVVREDLRCLEN